jgi:RimJ/RimL family protein N-acetyltransferase
MRIALFYIYNKILVIKFFLINLKILIKVPKIEPQIINNIKYRGYLKSDNDQLRKLYNNSSNFLHYNIMINFFKIIGSHSIIIAVNFDDIKREILVGANIYYISNNDYDQNTVHEGYIEVIPSMQNQGIASNMRKIAQKHFLNSGFSKISTRISKYNLPSLHSAFKNGFKIIHEYTDKATYETRYYMIYFL